MFNISYIALGAIALGLVLTLLLAAWCTPSHWWRQMNLRALTIVGLGTWGIATLILWLAQPPALRHEVAAVSVLGHSFRVYDDLNLRAAKGTAARRIAVVPAGALVTTTGLRDGDWWQLRARVEGKDIQGWASSLWLRRADETASAAPTP
ncbi:MAG: SH3 domain-containing protein [Massilia sp.]